VVDVRDDAKVPDDAHVGLAGDGGWLPLASERGWLAGIGGWPPPAGDRGRLPTARDGRG
jgi:hypothetical protein